MNSGANSIDDGGIDAVTQRAEDFGGRQLLALWSGYTWRRFIGEHEAGEDVPASGIEGGGDVRGEGAQMLDGLWYTSAWLGTLDECSRKGLKLLAVLNWVWSLRSRLPCRSDASIVLGWRRDDGELISSTSSETHAFSCCGDDILVEFVLLPLPSLRSECGSLVGDSSWIS